VAIAGNIGVGKTTMTQLISEKLEWEAYYEPVITKAHELGIGTIVMNPCGGGKFVENSAVLMRIAEAVDAVFGEIAEALAKDNVLGKLKGPEAHEGFRRLLGEPE